MNNTIHPAESPQSLFSGFSAFYFPLLPEGAMVYLQKDVSETDRYGCLLRYVWFGLPKDPLGEKELREKVLNAILLGQDMAEPMNVAPDLLYSGLFHKINPGAALNIRSSE